MSWVCIESVWKNFVKIGQNECEGKTNILKNGKILKNLYK